MATAIQRQGRQLVVEDVTSPVERLGAVAMGAILLLLAVGVGQVSGWTGAWRVAAWVVFGGCGVLLLAMALLRPRQRLRIDLEARTLEHGRSRFLAPWTERRWPLSELAGVERLLLPGDDVKDAHGLALVLKDGTRLVVGRVFDREEVDRLVEEVSAAQGP